MELEEIIKKQVLKNAYEYGQAKPGAVVGKVISEYPQAKEDMKRTMERINNEVNRVNSLKKEEIKNEMADFEYKEKKEEEKKISVPNAVDGKVVTRLPPEPNAQGLHIGHAKAMYLDYEIAQLYNGKCILRFDDTNPEKEKQEYVDAIKKDLEWLQIKWDEEVYASDKMEKMYELGKELLEKEKAYICTCSGDIVKQYRQQKKECSCRARSKEENLLLWNKMIEGGFEPGKVIMRFKGDMASKNTAMRDPTMFRIIVHPHYRQGDKYRIWPSYDFEGAVTDSILGITHPIRSKEYELRDEIYFAVLDALGLRKPDLITISRLNVSDAELSKRKLKILVEEGKVSGWDDPRLPTIKGMARRGIRPDAIKSFVLQFGISKVESRPSLEKLYVENKKLLDHITIRRFFVAEPVLIKVENAPFTEIELYSHPQNPELGLRMVEIKDKFYIPKEDFNNLNIGDDFRLKDAYNIKITGKTPMQITSEYDGKELKQNKKIQWVTFDNLQCEVIVPGKLFDENGNYNENSLETVYGLCEESCSELKIGDIVQFERFGFVRLDRKEGDKLIFIYCHK